MTGWFWLLFALACLACLVAVPISMRHEQREYERDRQAWREMGGGRL